MKKSFVLLIFIFVQPIFAEKFELKNYPTLVLAQEYVKDLEVDLKYATLDNFAKKILYTSLNQCYLQKDAAIMLQKADVLLKKINSNLSLHAYDCMRPKSAQIEMWDVVKGTKSEPYVANPNKPIASVHNYGCAIDITLSLKGVGPVDMGVPFDFFGEESQPKFEIQLMAKNKLSLKSIENRLLLRYVMASAGFLPISNEWWHFNCATDSIVRERYKIIE